MSALLALTAPLLIAAGLLAAQYRGIDAFQALTEGARKGLGVLRDMFPALLILLPALKLLQSSGLPELLAPLLGPLLRRLGIPPETGPLLLLRPFSGSAALAAAAELIETHGPDSPVGRCAAVMLGSSETTFSVAAVDLAAADTGTSRWALPAALCADLACFVSSAWICRLLWG